MDEMVDRLLDILADKLTERLSAGHKELYTAKELAERYGVSCATIRSKMAAGEFGELLGADGVVRLETEVALGLHEVDDIVAAALDGVHIGSGTFADGKAEVVLHQPV